MTGRRTEINGKESKDGIITNKKGGEPKIPSPFLKA
jgi:hypothetical protein